MKAKIVTESISFKRGQNSHDVLSIGDFAEVTLEEFNKYKNTRDTDLNSALNNLSTIVNKIVIDYLNNIKIKFNKKLSLVEYTDFVNKLTNGHADHYKLVPAIFTSHELSYSSNSSFNTTFELLLIGHHELASGKMGAKKILFRISLFNSNDIGTLL